MILMTDGEQLDWMGGGPEEPEWVRELMGLPPARLDRYGRLQGTTRIYITAQQIAAARERPGAFVQTAAEERRRMYEELTYQRRLREMRALYEDGRRHDLSR